MGLFSRRSRVGTSLLVATAILSSRLRGVQYNRGRWDLRALRDDTNLRRCVRPKHATNIGLSAVVDKTGADWRKCDARGGGRTGALSQSDFGTAKTRRGKPDFSASSRPHIRHVPSSCAEIIVSRTSLGRGNCYSQWTDFFASFSSSTTSFAGVCGAFPKAIFSNVSTFTIFCTSSG
jgi:hypothetical protein